MGESPRTSPYQGLTPFDEADAAYFFGRDKDARLIVADLFASPLTLLYGASGVGKSSVLRAGVVPLLRGQNDVVVVFFNAWQTNPLGGLKNAVAEAIFAAQPLGSEFYLKFSDLISNRWRLEEYLQAAAA